jgi:hypothetical protein
VLRRYGGSKLERARDMFESALKGKALLLIWSYNHFDLQLTACASLSLQVCHTARLNTSVLLFLKVLSVSAALLADILYRQVTAHVVYVC